jgi:hypothetical protein
MARLTMQDLLNIKQFCHGKLNKTQTKENVKQVGACSYTIGKAFMSRILWRGFLKF